MPTKNKTIQATCNVTIIVYFCKNKSIETMAVILHIETSTDVCSVAVSENGKCIFERECSEGMNHAKLLSPFVDEALKQISAENKDIEAVAVSCGPGSYTGLRIGVSTAKGIAYGKNIPLIAVPTLEIIAVGALKNIAETDNFLLCPMIDARRMEVYDVFLDKNLTEIRATQPDILDENSFSDELKNVIYFFGNGSAKFKNITKNSNARFVENIAPLAKNMISIAEKRFAKRQFEDVAYFEPFYLKEFQPTTPKNN